MPHAESYKAHRNGIKKPRRHRYRSSKGVDPKFLRNKRYALRGSRKALAEAKAAKAAAEA